MLVEWDDELSVGIQEIDEQHKVLVGLVNEMHDAIHEHQGREASIAILVKLVDYTKIHFAVEESLMRIFEYPEYEEHKEQHAALLDEIAIMQEKIDAGGAISFQLLHFLKMWLTKHIVDSDKNYTEHFLNTGVKATTKNQSWFSRLWH
ncbi:hemerythrin [Ectothiorhodospiraceae bacterium BW-2]|nr:hemerythrin [Ectothiorhodospiraceae bacterium BW-2]